jgi:GNAT superfamily N-acetyltransferase
VLVADVDGAVAGMCQVSVIRQLEHLGASLAELDSIHVVEAYRSAGITPVLTDAAIALARDAGCYRIQLTKQKDRPSAVAFYESVGFVASYEGLKLDLT